MNYQIIAIGLWIGLSIVFFFLSRKSVIKQFGTPNRRFSGLDWRAYLLCVVALAGLLSMGVTFLIRSIFS